MGLEYRKSRRYYTRSKRVNGKVQREYVGSGLLAEMAAFNDEADRLIAKAVHQREQEHWRQERDAALALEQAVGAVCEDADRLFRETMAAAGYHQHARGEWRKKRKEKPNADAITGTDIPSQAAERHDAG